MPFSRVAATWVASNIAGMTSVLLLALRLIRLCGITTFEKTVHMITDSDEVGFKGHIKKYGSPARQKHFCFFC